MFRSSPQLDNETKRALKTSAALCSVSLLSCMLTRNIVSGAVWNILPASGAADRLAALTAMAAGFFVMTAVFLKSPKKDLSGRKRPVKACLCLFGILAALCVMSRVLTAALTDLLWALGIQFNQSAMPLEKREFIVWAVSSVVIAPVLEETAFHKAMLTHLAVFGERFALIAATVLFAALHGAPTMWPNALLVGGFIGAAVLYTGSLKVGVALHMTNNIIALFESLLWESGLSVIPQIRLAAATAMLLLGVFSGMRLYKSLPENEECETDTAEKLGVFFVNMPMLLIVAVAILVAKEAAL